jgi:DNA-directed RNA polymerase specialized sigma24 family protein
MAFAALSQADFARLGSIAQARARGLPELDWRDLVQEAVRRALDGTRRWPTGVPFLAFLAGVIRSLVSEHWRQRSDRRTISAPLDDGPDACDMIADESPDPERSAVARDLLSRLVHMFEGDDRAQSILDGLANGQSPSEIQSSAGMTAVEYDSGRRRIRRAIARATPEMM